MAPRERGKVSGDIAFPDVGVLAVVPDEWDSTTWMPRHQILSRLVKYFHVLWLNPARHWREVFSGRGRRMPRAAGENSGLAVEDGSWWLPQVYRPAAVARLLERGRIEQARQKLIARGCRRIILYLWRPSFEGALDAIEYDISCYHIDDEYSFSPIEGPISAQETRVIKRVDQVFIHSKALLEKKGGLNPHTLWVPNGVDFAAYAVEQREPNDLAAIPPPRMGYIGLLKTQIDFGLLRTLAERHKEWSFVLVGPKGYLGDDAAAPGELERMPNVYLLGGKPLDALPAYTQHLNVGMLCYKVNGYTKFIYPLKLHEYLASGRPAVGSAIPAVEDFRDILGIARTPEEWSRLLVEALEERANTAEAIEERRSVARQYDWSVIAQRIAEAMCERLGRAGGVLSGVGRQGTRG